MTESPTRDPLFDRLAEEWTRHDPVPPALVDRMVRAVRAELAADPLDVEYELLVLTSSSDQLVGTRATVTGPVTCRATMRWASGTNRTTRFRSHSEGDDLEADDSRVPS